MTSPLRLALTGTDSPLAEAIRRNLHPIDGARLVSPAEHPDYILHLGGNPPPAAASASLWRLHLHPPGRFLRAAALEQITAHGNTTLDLRILPAALSSEQALFALADAPARICRLLLAGVALPPPALLPPYVPPAGLAEKLRQQVRNTLLTEIWHVGLVHAPIASFLDPQFEPRIQWLANTHPRHFFADPFLAIEPGGLEILVEEYDYRHDPVGRIATIAFEQGRFHPPARRIFPAPHHMSYPFLFSWQGQRYAIPESWERNCVRLHRWDPLSKSWDAGKTILDGLAAVDSTVFHHNHRWWLFCTEKSPTVDCRLLIYHADHFEGPWVPHLANPVKVDIRSARPGGTPFHVGESLYRPAQDCSESYGCRLALNRITTLTPTSFAEETVRVLRPHPSWPCRDGFHTLSGEGDWTILDAKRMTLLADLAIGRISHKIKRLMGYGEGNSH